MCKNKNIAMNENIINNTFDISITPGYGVDLETWESKIIDIKQCNWLTREKVLEIVDNPYSNAVKKVTSNMAEDIACRLLWCKKINKTNNKWFDAILSTWEQLEIKVGRIWNAAVIRKNQLETLENNWYYALIFYRTINNIPPTHILEKAILENMHITPEVYLKRNILIESVFVLPRSYIVYYYNSHYVKERLIKSDLRKIKPICQTNALHLYNEVEIWNHKKSHKQVKEWKNNINIYSIWIEIS